MTTLAEQHRDELVTAQDRVSALLTQYDLAADANFARHLVNNHLSILLESLSGALAGTCPERPEELAGRPIGQYHCPHCGCTAMAGVTGHFHDEGCWLGLNDPDQIQLPGPQP